MHQKPSHPRSEFPLPPSNCGSHSFGSVTRSLEVAVTPRKLLCGSRGSLAGLGLQGLDAGGESDLVTATSLVTGTLQLTAWRLAVNWKAPFRDGLGEHSNAIMDETR